MHQRFSHAERVTGTFLWAHHTPPGTIFLAVVFAYFANQRNTWDQNMYQEKKNYLW